MILERDLDHAIAAHYAPDLIVEAETLCERLWMASINVTAAREARIDRILKRAEARLQRREFAELDQAYRPMTTDCANCYHVGACFFDGETYICADREACKVRARVSPAACPFCGAPTHRKMCDPQRAAMAQTYTAAPASPGYVGIFSPSGEMSEQETADKLNELEAHVHALGIALDAARQHVQALLAAIAQARTTEDAFMRDSTRRNMSTAEDAEAALIRAENAARTWLRREAK